MKEQNELMKNLAVEMTARTGELWRAIIEERIGYLQSDSAYLYIVKVWNMQRIQIRASAPCREHQSGQSITCDMTRHPEAIARDIEQRLLEHARQHLKGAKAYDLKKRKEEAEENLRRNLIKQYIPRSQYHNDKFYTNTPKRKSKNNLWAHIEYDNEIKIEISLPIKEAIKLIKHLKENY